MKFSTVAEQLYGLYGAGRYAEALGLVGDVRGQFPSEDAMLTFWEACLLSMDGSPATALSVLREGLDRGLWWSEATLADPDLDAVRLLTSWDELLRDSDGWSLEARATRPAARKRVATGSEPKGVVVALHGAQANPAEHADVWDEAVSGDWMVIAPAGVVPAMPNRWSWPLAEDKAVEAVVSQLPELALDQSLVVGGFSQGGRVALNLVSSGTFQLRGLILFAPALRAEALPSIPDVPTFVYVGDEDWALVGVDALAEAMSDAGAPIHVERIVGLGHVMPPNLAAVVERALDWIGSF